MSLLVVNSANKVSQGVIRHLYQSGKFERIVCADIYPSYTVHQKWFKFLDELPQNSNTKLTDIKIEERSDLARAIKGSTHVLYVTHDYYRLVFSKLTMIVNTAKIVNQSPNVKKFVALNPIEHYHYGEENAFQAHVQAEEDARKSHEKTVSLQSDLVFGPYSTVVRNLVCRMSNKRKLHFSPSNNTVSPIHCDNLSEVVQNALLGDVASGVVKGNDKLQWNEILSILESALGQKSTVGSRSLGSPLTNNLLSEMCYQSCYKNMVQFINKYEGPKGEFENKSNLSLKSFKQTYPENSLQKSDFLDKTSNFECTLKWMFG